ncbi:ephrin-A2 [Mustela nigripes]|uniref:ephrin-A2 n=1 Tax=Mustela nigripes TaxID=77151 RepID=UPI0028169DA4|nr:ephrin-A2 [Mustela nigripes]
MAPAQRPLLPLLLLLLPLPPPPSARAEDAARANSDRYAVYWNRSNPRSCSGPSSFPGLGGPPSWGLSGGAPAGVIVGGDPRGTLSLNCATWGTVAPRARGPWGGGLSRRVSVFQPDLGTVASSGSVHHSLGGPTERPSARRKAARSQKGEMSFCPRKARDAAPGGPLLHQSPAPFLPAATPPNAVDRPCLRLKVYVRPTNETLYEAPEPIFTSNNSCSGLGSCRLVLGAVPVLWTLLGS